MSDRAGEAPGRPAASPPDEPYEVLALRYGTAPAHKSEVYHRYPLYGEPDQEIVIDFYLWVIRNQHRTVVVDTGFERGAGARRGRQVVRPPELLLAEVGTDPADVELVVITHLHYDHVGNLGLFPQAQFLVDDRELDFWTTAPSARRPLFAHSVEPREIEQVSRLERQGRVQRLGASATIVPGVHGQRVGGHTPGQQILRVRTAEGEVVLASDALHFYEELDHDRPFAILSDLDEMYRGYDTLRRLAARPATVILAGHDPLVRSRFPPIRTVPAGCGVRVGKEKTTE